MLEKAVHIANAARVDKTSVGLFGFVFVADVPTRAGSPELQFVAGFKSLYNVEEEVNFICYNYEMAETFQGLVDVVHLPKQRLGGLT